MFFTNPTTNRRDSTHTFWELVSKDTKTLIIFYSVRKTLIFLTKYFAFVNIFIFVIKAIVFITRIVKLFIYRL